MTAEQSIFVSQKGNVTVIHLAALLNDRELVMEFADQILKYIDKKEPDRLLLNFASVRRFSSEAINAIIRANERIKARDGRMILCGLSSNIRQVFKISGLDGTILDIYDSCSEATESLSK